MTACDELYISFLFPPSDYVSGITVFKRIAVNGKKVDVLQADFKSDNLSQFNNYVDEYINNRILIDIDCDNDWANCIFKFQDMGLKAIKNDYKKIYSRSWLMANHFLASQYKFKNPEVIWHAEFSDPLIYDLSNKPKTYKQMKVNDKDYILKINEKIDEFNKNNNTDFVHVENNSQAYFIAEYLVYLFADEVIFTNENQREVMLDQFQVDVKDMVLKKSQIKIHPTLDDKFYHIKDVDLNLNPDEINIAYFGKDYYGKRHFEALFYTLDSLNHRYKDKIKIHIFIDDTQLVKSLISSTQSSDNFTVRKPIGYLEFLNATTKFDVLLVSDVETKPDFELNPYLPSKLSDYMGSSADIWGICEKGSSLSKMDLKYKSYIGDIPSLQSQIIKILHDRNLIDENWSFVDGYLSKRLTALNELYEREFRRKIKLSEDIKKLQNENKQIKSSNSWNPFKKLKK